MTNTKITTRAPQRASFRIDEFCQRHGISRSAYYEYRKKGYGPREMRIGQMVRISRQAEEEWVRRMEGQDLPDPPAIDAPAPPAAGKWQTHTTSPKGREKR